MLINFGCVVHPVAVYFSSSESPAAAAKLRPVRLFVDPELLASVAAVESVFWVILGTQNCVAEVHPTEVDWATPMIPRTIAGPLFTHSAIPTAVLFEAVSRHHALQEPSPVLSYCHPSVRQMDHSGNEESEAE